MIRYSAITLQSIAGTILIAASTQALAYMEDNLLIRYDFNKGRGSVISDQTGLGYDANLQGNATFIDNDPWEETTGMAKFGNSIKFDGVGDYLNIESDFHNDQLNLDKVAIAAWVRPAAAGTGKQYLVSKLNHAAKTGYALAIDNHTGFLHAEIYLNGSASISEAISSIAIPNDVWTHLVASFDGRSIKLYLNGILNNSTSANGSITASAEEFIIGALSGPSPANEFSGAIDELRLYSAISAADVNILARANNGEPDLILYESFDTINRIFADAHITGASFRHLDNTDLVKGQFDNALHFQDDNQKDEGLNWPALNTLNSAQGHITMWFRPDWSGNVGSGNSILETDNQGLAGNGSGDGIRVQRWRGQNTDGTQKFRLLVRNNEVTSLYQEPSGIRSWKPNEWHYLELIWDTTNATPFLAYILDGEIASIKIDASNAASGTPTTLFLGSHDSFNGMGGTIDELKIYSRPQYDVFNNAEKISAITAINRADGKKQPFETVYNSADATFPNAVLAAKTPVVFYQTAPFEPVYAGDLPDAASVSDTLSYTTAKNDTQSLFFNIYSQLDADDVSITVNSLKDASGITIINAKDMELMVVKKWWQRPTIGLGRNPFIPIFVPELLMYDDRYNFKHDDYDIGPKASHSWDNLPDFPVPTTASVNTELKAYTSKQFMLKIKIPDTVTAGTYTTTAIVSAPDFWGSRLLTLNINIRDIKLPKANKDFIIWHRARYLGSPYLHQQRDIVGNQDYYLLELQDIFDHGFNGIYAYGADHSYITHISNTGFDGKVILHNTTADLSTVAALNTTFGEAWFYGFDEPNEAGELSTQMSRSSNIHAVGGKVATSIFLPWADCLSYPRRLRPDLQNNGDLRDFCPSADNPPTDADNGLDMENVSVSSLLGTTQEYFYGLLNDTITRDPIDQSYYWQSRAEDARVNRYLAGFHLYQTNLNGIWPYVYIHNNGSDPFDDLDSNPDFDGSTKREMGLAYPTQQGPMSTIEWEAMREGIDDYRYLQLWQSLHDNMLTEDPATAARSRARIELNENGIGLSLFRHQLAGALNLSNADFDAMRELIAEEILMLQFNLSDPDGDKLSTATELLLGTDPLDPDSDNDWLRDNFEIINGTDPLKGDTDGDKSGDFSELYYGIDPLDPAEHL
jgi:hypothetical protein